MKIILDRVDLDHKGCKIASFEVDGKIAVFNESQVPFGFFDSLIPNAIVECEITDNRIVNPVILFEETKEKEEKMKKRMQSLFKRKNQ